MRQKPLSAVLRKNERSQSNLKRPFPENDRLLNCFRRKQLNCIRQMANFSIKEV